MKESTFSKYGLGHEWGRHYFVNPNGVMYNKFDNLYIPIPNRFKEDLVNRFVKFEKLDILPNLQQCYNQWSMCREFSDYCTGCPFTNKYKLIVSCVDWQKNIDPLFNIEWLHVASRLQHVKQIKEFWEKARHFIEFY